MKRIPQNEIYRILSGLAGTVGLYVEDCQSGEIFTINPEHVFPSASVIKVPMLALLMRDAQQGRRCGASGYIRARQEKA